MILFYLAQDPAAPCLPRFRRPIVAPRPLAPSSSWPPDLFSTKALVGALLLRTQRIDAALLRSGRGVTVHIWRAQCEASSPVPAHCPQVQKRRIYDITNVLEGVDLIEKGLKNMIRWKGFDMLMPKEMEHQTSALKEEIESSYDEDSMLDEKILEVQEKLQAVKVDKDKRKWLYLSKEDIGKIPRFQGSTLIAINAPHGTSVEVPDPDADLDIYKDLESQEKRYQILLRSSMGPIDCYLISGHQEISNPEQMAPDSLDPAVTTGSSQASQQVDCDQSQALEKGESNVVGKHTSEPSRTHELMSGILRIVPSDADIDADYWLASDVDASMTDTWGT